MGENGGKWGKIGGNGENGGYLVEEGGKLISFAIQVPKNLQKWAPIIVVGSLLHHVSPSCGWCGPALPYLLATYLTVVAQDGAHVLPRATL